MFKALVILQLFFLLVAYIINCKYPFKCYKWLYVASYILYVPLSMYLSQFWHHSFSDDPNMWGVFGDFMGGTYNVLTSLLLGYISYRISKFQTQGEISQKAAKEILKQVNSMKCKNYHHKSVEKLQRLVREYEFYIGGLLKENIIMLADNYTRARVDSFKINTNLEKAVIAELKRLANE